MPRGRSFFGRGFWWRGAMLGGYPAYVYPFFGVGRGNPFGFCRWFPWLPRWWWATSYAPYCAATIPYYGLTYGAPPTYPTGYGAGLPYSPFMMPPFAAAPYGWGQAPSSTTPPPR